MQPADCYEILGVPPEASTEEVTAAYKKLSEKFRPDANAGDPFSTKDLKRYRKPVKRLSMLLLFPHAKSGVKQSAV